MNAAYLSVSMTSARSVAANLATRGYDAEAFLSLVTASLYDLTGPGLGANGVKPDGKHDDGHGKSGLGQFSPSAAGAILLGNEARSI